MLIGIVIEFEVAAFDIPEVGTEVDIHTVSGITRRGLIESVILKPDSPAAKVTATILGPPMLDAPLSLRSIDAFAEILPSGL